MSKYKHDPHWKVIGNFPDYECSRGGAVRNRKWRNVIVLQFWSSFFGETKREGYYSLLKDGKYEYVLVKELIRFWRITDASERAWKEG